MRISFFIMLSLVCNLLIAADSKIKIVFRYDDFTLENSTFQDSLLQVFDQHSIPLSIAVIPYDKSAVPKPYSSMTPERLDYLKGLIQKNIIEVTQHGFNHTKNTISEFKGVDEAKQYALIDKGKRYLDSVLNTNITTFIPPWNQYDSTTLEVLKKLNFKGISADIYGVATSDNIAYMPCTDKYVYDIKDLVEKNKNKDIILIVMLHHYNFYGTGTEFKITRKSSLVELSDVLQWLNRNKIQCCSFAQLIASGEDLGTERYLVNSKLFDGVISRRFWLYYVPVDYKIYKVWDKVFWVGYYLIILLVIWAGATLLKIKLSRRAIVILWIACICLLIAFLLYGRFTHKLMFVINSFGALCMFASFLLIKRKKS